MMIESLFRNVPIPHGADFVEWEHPAEAEADHQTNLPAAEVVDLMMLTKLVLMISMAYGNKVEGRPQVPRWPSPELCAPSPRSK